MQYKLDLCFLQGTGKCYISVLTILRIRKKKINCHKFMAFLELRSSEGTCSFPFQPQGQFSLLLDFTLKCLRF